MNPVFGWGSFQLDEDRGRVTAQIGPGLARTTAVYRQNLGCTLAHGIEAEALPALPATLRKPVAPEGPFRPLPPNPALESLLDQAFAEPAADSRRNTRAVIVLHRGATLAVIDAL